VIAGFCLCGLARAATNDLPDAAGAPQPAAAGKSWIDPEDGWLDASKFVDQAYGFVPIAMPITEPAVGYGAAGGLVFIDKPEEKGEAGFRRPNLTIVGGLGTENGSWGVLAADVRYWLDDRLQTLAGAVYAPLNLEFFGIGEGSMSEPLAYTITPVGGMLKSKYRLGGQSRWWAGLGYAFASTEVEFDAPASLPPGILPTEGVFRTGGLTPSLSFDSRNNFFTPTRGFFMEASCGLFSEALGGDSEFQKPVLVMIGYVPLHRKLTLGVRGDVSATFGDPPFYLRPFIYMRGVAAMRYQGEEVAQIEAELRWQFWNRFSIVGFAGVGSAWNDFERFDSQATVAAGGLGLRYELARKYGLHLGVDVAFGPDDPVFYIQFGSAWMRP
jgi:outer membrane protein assembly factor BamA